MEVETMEKNRKELKVLHPLEICGDGSCGCGCGGLMETKEVSSEENIQEIRSSSSEEPLEVTGNPGERKGVEK